MYIRSTFYMTSDKPIYVLTNIWKGFPDSSVGKESACNAGDPGSIPVWKSPWRRDRLPTPVFLGFSCGSAGKESACSWDTWVQSLGWEDLALRIPWTV